MTGRRHSRAGGNLEGGAGRRNHVPPLFASAKGGRGERSETQGVTPISPSIIDDSRIMRIMPPMKQTACTKHQLRHVARDMRNKPTDPERLLWHRLRMKRLDGHRFLRQKVIGNAIVDFVCPRAGLVVELDGGQHDERSDADEARTRRLNRRERLSSAALLEPRSRQRHGRRHTHDPAGAQGLTIPPP